MYGSQIKMIAYKKMTLLKGKFLSVQGEYYSILTSARDISQNANMCDKKEVSFVRNCGAESAGEYNKVIWFYQLS